MMVADLKAWRTLQAELLLGGFKADLDEGDDGLPELVVSRRSETRRFTNMGEARAWADKMLGHQSQFESIQPAQDVRVLTRTQHAFTELPAPG